MVEIADDGDALRVGRPHRERRAPDPADVDDMASQLLVLRQVAPLGQEVDVETGEDRSERVGVVLRPPVAVAAGDLEPVREDLRVEREAGLEHPVGVDAGHGGAPRRAVVPYHLDLAGPGLDHPDGDEPPSSFLHDVGAEDGEGVPVTGADEEVEVLLPESGLHRPSIVAETGREGAGAVAGPANRITGARGT